MTPILFVYGTLMEPRLLEGVLGHGLGRIGLWPARAEGFRTVHYPGRIYPALIAAPGRVAEGVAIAGLGARDLDILDLFEGDEYIRDEIGISLVRREGKPGSGDNQNPSFLAMEAALAAQSAHYYRPRAAIADTAMAWTFAGWRREHGEAMIVAEGKSAAALRAQLIARGG